LIYYKENLQTFVRVCGPGNVVDIATGYGLKVRESNPGGGEIFPRLSRPALGPTQLPVQWIFPGGKERSGRETDPSSPSSAVGHERVELYLYSPYGPYGLYRASVPVQGCILPLPYRRGIFIHNATI